MKSCKPFSGFNFVAAVKQGPPPLHNTSSQTMKAVSLTSDLQIRIKRLIDEIRSELALLDKSLNVPNDHWSLKMRAEAIQDRADKLLQIAAKLEVLGEIKETC